KLS
ncbi:extracellular deoxyribonuclease, partial [Vibrio parahaemolyticus V-223/04]